VEASVEALHLTTQCFLSKSAYRCNAKFIWLRPHSPPKRSLRSVEKFASHAWCVPRLVKKVNGSRASRRYQTKIHLHHAMDFDCDSCPLAPGQCDVFDPKKNGALKQRAVKKLKTSELNSMFHFGFFQVQIHVHLL
jgi:hypothetical protein